jgi:hypothetical protein
MSRISNSTVVPLPRRAPIALRTSTSRQLGFVVLSGVGWFIAVIAGSPGLLCTVLPIGLTLGGLTALWDTVRSRGQVWNLLLLSSVSIALSQNLLLTLAIANNLAAPDDPYSSAAREVGCTAASYSIAMAYTMAFALCLALLSQLRSSITSANRFKLAFARFANCSMGQLSALAFVVIITEAALIATGRWGFRGIVRDNLLDRRLSWYSDFLTLLPHLNLMLAAVLVGRLSQQQHRNRREFRLMALAVVLMCVFSTFTQDRRFLFYSGFAAVVLYAEVRQIRLTVWKLFVPSMILGAVVWQASLFNNFLRSTDSGLSQWQNVDALTLIGKTWERFLDPNVRARQQEATVENFATRGLVLQGLAKIINEEPRGLPLLGEDLFNSSMVAFPTLIVGPKSEYPVQEALIYRRTGLAFNDLADSAYLSGYLDFGYAGAITHACVLAFVFYIASQLVYGMHPLTAGAAICPWLHHFLVGVNESSMSVNMRYILVTMVFFAIGRFLRDRSNRGSAR